MIPRPASRAARARFWFWLAIAVAFFAFLTLIKSILLPFVVGIFSAYFLDPAVRKLRRWGWSRSVASAVITVGFFLAALLLCIVLAPHIARQLGALLSALPDYLQNLQDRYGSDLAGYVDRLSPDEAGTIKNAAGTMSAAVLAGAGRVASHVVQSGLAALNVLLLIFLTPVVAFYLLRDWDLLIIRFDQLLPRDLAPAIRAQLREIDRTLSAFLRGQTNVCLIMATYYGIALSLAGLKFGLLIGIFTGFFLFVPFVGFLTGFSLSLIVALFQFGPSAPVLIVLGVYAAGQAMEAWFLTPRLVGGKVGLHPIWIIFGMLAGGALFGFVGILIAVPLTAILGVLVRFAAKRYLESSFYRGAPETPSVVIEISGPVE